MLLATDGLFDNVESADILRAAVDAMAEDDAKAESGSSSGDGDDDGTWGRVVVFQRKWLPSLSRRCNRILNRTSVFCLASFHTSYSIPSHPHCLSPSTLFFFISFLSLFNPF